MTRLLDEVADVAHLFGEVVEHVRLEGHDALRGEAEAEGVVERLVPGVAATIQRRGETDEAGRGRGGVQEVSDAIERFDVGMHLAVVGKGREIAQRFANVLFGQPERFVAAGVAGDMSQDGGRAEVFTHVHGDVLDEDGILTAHDGGAGGKRQRLGIAGRCLDGGNELLELFDRFGIHATSSR